MCLERISEKMVADRDITVYKRLMTKLVYDPTIDGKHFECEIKKVLVKGKLSVERGLFFFCTNDPQFDGQVANDMKGYKYSWVLDDRVNMETLKIEGTKTKALFKEILCTPYQQMPITLGKEYVSEISFVNENTKYMKIEKGLHSFKDRRGAIYDGHGFVVECIIPKGTEYWEGYFFGEPSIASRRLVYGSKLEKIGE